MGLQYNTQTTGTDIALRMAVDDGKPQRAPKRRRRHRGAEHPQLVAFEKNQSTQDNGVELVTVGNDDSDAAVAAFFEKNGGDWPKVTDPDGAIAVAFGVAKVPETWVIDPSGFVRLRIAGEVTNDFLSAKMAELQRELAAP